jgi:Flp pilus assembly protein TadG
MRRPALLSRLARLRRDRSGVTIVEFAIVLPVLCILLVGTFELGYRSYVTAVVQGALREAARMATVGGVSMEEIDARVRARLSDFARNATVTTSATSYFEFADVGQPEKITSDTAPLGQYNPGDCFEDANGNGTYDLDRGRGGLGQADDVVRYRASITYPSMFPIGSLFGWGHNVTVSAETMLRNQPYAGRNTSVVIVC